MFPTRCRTEVRRLYIVHSEFSETTLFQGQAKYENLVTL